MTEGVKEALPVLEVMIGVAPKNVFPIFVEALASGALMVIPICEVGFEFISRPFAMNGLNKGFLLDECTAEQSSIEILPSDGIKLIVGPVHFGLDILSEL